VALGCPRLESSEAPAPPTGDGAWDLLHFSQFPGDLSAGDWPELHIRALEIVEDYARQHPDRRVAIKLHPASRAYDFCPPPIQSAHLVTANSLALIRSARVVLVVSSTTGIEAMCLGRPVLQVLPQGIVASTDFIADSGAVRVDSVEGLAAAAEHLLSDRSAYRDASERGRAYARSFIQGFGQPGEAVRRLEDLVAELRHS
jgi:glycosyltransferase involved in cell wall biosynthesis